MRRRDLLTASAATIVAGAAALPQSAGAGSPIFRDKLAAYHRAKDAYNDLLARHPNKNRPFLPESEAWEEALEKADGPVVEALEALIREPATTPREAALKAQLVRLEYEGEPREEQFSALVRDLERLAGEVSS